MSMTDAAIPAPPAEVQAVSPAGPAVAASPRRPWIAVLAGLLIYGLGHVYAGRALRGFALVAGLFVVDAALIAAMVRVDGRWLHLALLAALFAGLVAYLADAARAARRAPRPYQRRWYNRWWAYAAVIAAGIVTSQLCRAGVLQLVHVFRIPGRSMLPGVEPGDFIIFQPTHSPPARGEVVAYRNAEGTTVLHRVAAIGGDTVEMRGGVLYLNGKRVAEPYARVTPAPPADPARLEWQRDFLVGRDPAKYAPTSADWGPLAVPAGHLLLLGDNPSAAYDGRFEGFVRDDAVIARAAWIYFSSDRAHGTVRWSRIGQSIH